MQRAHKIRLVPTRTQEQALRKACGTARYTWNWALAEWQKQYKEGSKPTAFSLKKQWNACKPEWVYESPKDCNQNPFDNLQKAYVSFFRGKANKPVFKKKGVSDSFYVSNDRFRCLDKKVRLPVIGMIRMRETLRFEGRILSGTVSCTAGQWYLSVQVEIPDRDASRSSSVVGVDAGIGRIGIASDGTECVNPRSLKRLESKLRKAQRSLSRKVKGSANHQKTIVKLQKIHKKVSDTRNDAIHKFTYCLAKNHGKAVVETLDIVGMKDKAQRWLRVLLQDTAMREMHRQLEYKMSVVKAPPFFASSKTCSACGLKKDELSLSTRIYHCDGCGMVEDRDVNAAINLKLMRWATPCRPVEAPAKGPTKQEAGDTHLCVELV